MKINFFLLLSLPSVLFEISCADESILPNGEQQTELITKQDKATNARAAASGQYILRDWSGGLETLTIYKDVGTGGEVNSGYVQLPPEYVVIAGGAMTSGVSAGVFLTECRPDFTANRWYVASKSHIDSDPHILTCYAVGLKVQGVTPQTLRSVMTVTQSTSTSASHPSTEAQISAPYSLIGGGAKVNWSGWGNLLVYSRPSGQGWFVGSKDHLRSSPATITAWAIGIQDYIPGFGYIDIKKSQAATWASTGYSWATVQVNDTPAFVNINAGALVDYADTGYGRMLAVLVPDINNGWAAMSASKDHQRACSGYLYTFSIGLRKRP